MADEVSSSGREIDHAYVRETRTPQLEMTFIRLIGVGEVPIDEISSYTVEDCECTFDKDDEGNLIGVTIVWFKNLANESLDVQNQSTSETESDS